VRASARMCLPNLGQPQGLPLPRNTRVLLTEILPDPGPGPDTLDDLILDIEAQTMKHRRVTVILAGLTLLVLALSLPGSLRNAYDRGGLYLFSRAFLEDIPKRLAGPGRFRFILQPVTAIVLGIRNGLADARAGRPPYLYGVLIQRRLRRELLRSGFESVVNLLLMGILMDVVCQWLILGVSYPGAALVVGPVLIGGPYAVARALSNRFAC
jgi:hypothetical protein